MLLARAAFVGAVKALEHMCLFRIRHAGAVVLHRKQYPAFFRAGAQRDVAAGGRVGAGVADEDQQQLAQPSGVAPQGRQCFLGQIQRKAQAARFYQRRKLFMRADHQRIGIHRFHTHPPGARVAACKQEKIVHQAGHAVGLAADGRQVLRRVRRAGLHGRQARLDDGQRAAQLVSGGGHEFPLFLQCFGGGTQRPPRQKPVDRAQKCQPARQQRRIQQGLARQRPAQRPVIPQHGKAVPAALSGDGAYGGGIMFACVALHCDGDAGGIHRRTRRGIHIHTLCKPCLCRTLQQGPARGGGRPAAAEKQRGTVVRDENEQSIRGLRLGKSRVGDAARLQRDDQGVHAGVEHALCRELRLLLCQPQGDGQEYRENCARQHGENKCQAAAQLAQRRGVRAAGRLCGTAFHAPVPPSSSR